MVGGTLLDPEQLLAALKQIELVAGRQPGPRFGPRHLDLDLLILGESERHDPELTLPHPRLRDRRFYLEPLAEIAPDLRVPPDGASVRELLRRLKPGPRLERLEI